MFYVARTKDHDLDGGVRESDAVFVDIGSADEYFSRAVKFYEEVYVYNGAVINGRVVPSGDAIMAAVMRYYR